MRVVDLLINIANNESYKNPEYISYSNGCGGTFTMLVTKENIIDKLDKQKIDLSDHVVVPTYVIDIQSMEELDAKISDNIYDEQKIMLNKLLRWAKAVDKQLKENK